MRSLVYVTSFLCGSAGLIFAFCYVLRSGKFLKGALIGWGLSIICMFLASVVLPTLVAIYDTEYASLFPEAIAVPAIMVTGWVPGLLVAIVARLVKRGIEYRAKRPRPATAGETHKDG